MKKFNYGPGRNPERTVVHCPTKELAQRVFKVAHEYGYKWITGKSYLEDQEWRVKLGGTCYKFCTGTTAPFEWYKKEGYDVIPAEEFLALNEEFTLPKKWAVRLDFQEAVDYANENGKYPPYNIYDGIAHFPSVEHCGDYDLTCLNKMHTGYTLLTKEQFLQYVWKKPDAKERNPFKVGDRVFDHWYGWGICTLSGHEQVNIEFENHEVIRFVGPASLSFLSFTEYTLQGFSQERPEPKRPEIKKGQLIYVKDDFGEWRMRRFSGWDGDMIATFIYQETEGFTTTWKEYSLTNPLEETKS